MTKTMDAIYENGLLELAEPIPLQGRARVRVVIELPDVHERSGAKMARALEEIAFSDPPTQIGDPVEWQREIRRDRELPGRDA